MAEGIEARGRRDPGDVLVANQRRTASELLLFKRQLKKMGAKGPVLAAQKQKAKKLFERLRWSKKPMQDKARRIFEDIKHSHIPSGELAKEVQKIAVMMYLTDFMENAHRRALEDNKATNFASFISAFESTLNFLGIGKEYFRKPIEDLAIEFITLKASLDACAESFEMESLEFDKIIPAYARAAMDQVNKNEK